MKIIIIACLFLTASIAGRSQSINFSGNVNNNKVQLNWSTDSNQLTDRFEVEKSVDGTNFKIAALVFTSEKLGVEDYKFSETNSTGTIYYRLRIYGYDDKIKFSKTLSFSLKNGEQKNDR